MEFGVRVFGKGKGDFFKILEIGGFELFRWLVFELSVDFVAGFKPKKLHPCHCTAFCCRSAFRQIAEVEELGAGSVLEFA